MLGNFLTTLGKTVVFTLILSTSFRCLNEEIISLYSQGRLDFSSQFLQILGR